jgi:hypothetical protein
VLYAALVFLIFYATDSSRPRGDSVPLGWYGAWADQTEYYNMIKGISEGHLGRAMYPPGYPALGWLGSFVTPWDPLLVVDLLAFLVFIWCWLKVYSTFLPEGVALLSTVMLVHTSVSTFETPWTTTITASAVAILMYLYIVRQTSWWAGLVSGVMIGLVFGARVGDVLITAAAMLVYLAVVRPPRRFLFAMAVSTALLVAAVSLANHHFTGHPLGSYVQRVKQEGFEIGRIPVKLYGYFIDPWTYDRQHATPPVVKVVPAFALFVPGLLLLFRRHRDLALILAAITTSWMCIYAAYSFVKGSSLVLGSIHYVKVLFPIFIGCGTYALYCWVRGNEQRSGSSGFDQLR